MKSNPFLRAANPPNKTRNNEVDNNRFKLLDIEEKDTRNKKDKDKDKDKKPNLVSENIFTRPSSSSQNVSFHRDYRSKRRPPPPQEIPKPVFNLTNELFPDLGANHKKETTIEEVNEDIKKDITKSHINYRDIVNIEIEGEVIKSDGKDIVKPGWVEITSKRGINIYRYGAPTEYLKKMREKEEWENTPHFIMNKAVMLMSKKWDNYKLEYNSIHGEGAYEERFVLDPVYGPEYDIESDSDADEIE
jgi:hypothetical protein